MSFDYYYPVNITNDEIIYCKELKNKHVITLQKYLETTNNEIICDSFENLIKDCLKENYKLNYIDKFLVLLSLRKNSLGKSLDIKVGNSKNSISITNIEDQIIKNFKPQFHTISFKGIKVVVGIPLKLNYYDSFYSNIHKIEFEGNIVEVHKLSEKEFEEYLEYLPFELVKNIKRKTLEITHDVFSLFSVMNEDKKIDYYFSYKNEEIYNLLKLVYTDNLKNILYNQYICCSKLNISTNDFNNMSPGETKVIIKHYINELEKQNERKSGNVPPGLGNKPV